MIHQLFALDPQGPVALGFPPGLDDPSQVFDLLPDGIYEALRTFEHDRFVGLQEHLDRAQRSMGLYGLQAKLDESAMRKALHRIVTEFPAADCKLRFDVLCGPARALGSRSEIVLYASELALPAESAYREGVHTQIVSHPRRPRPAIKESRWVIERRPAEGQTTQNFESILVDGRGRLLEGIMSNFFGVRDGVVWTAPVKGVLPGVTRGKVLELCRDLELVASEQHVQAADLENLQEAFFSTSVRSLVPVVSVADVSIGDGRPGPITRRIMQAYGDLCRREAQTAI